MWVNEELGNATYTPYELAQKARAQGYRWITLEWNQHGNSTRGAAVKQECDRVGLVFTIWFTRSGQPENDMDFTPAEARKAIVESGCKGFLAEAEIPPELGGGVPNPQEQNWPALIHELEGLDIPKGVVTNFSPFVHHDGTPYREKSAPLIAAGWSCLTECFISEHASATPANGDDYAKRVLGWPETQPMVEVRRLEDYGDLSMYRNPSHWSAGGAL